MKRLALVFLLLLCSCASTHIELIDPAPLKNSKRIVVTSNNETGRMLVESHLREHGYTVVRGSGPCDLSIHLHLGAWYTNMYGQMFRDGFCEFRTPDGTVASVVQVYGPGVYMNYITGACVEHLKDPKK
jgi:hypothetical protein